MPNDLKSIYDYHEISLDVFFELSVQHTRSRLVVICVSEELSLVYFSHISQVDVRQYIRSCGGTDTGPVWILSRSSGAVIFFDTGFFELDQIVSLIAHARSASVSAS
jgi:hypothetical protein